MSYLGVDLGGTGVRVAKLFDDGRIEECAGFPTPKVNGRAALIGALQQFVDSDVRGIGIGASGPIGVHGAIENHETLPAFVGEPLADRLGVAFGLPCFIDNDAVTAALGEVFFGGTRGAASSIAVTLGTGVGVAMLSGRTPRRGLDGVHPEAGHMSVPSLADRACYCGRQNCWEVVASRQALERLVGGHRVGEPHGGLQRAADNARAGDEGMLRAFASYGAAVAMGLGNLQAIARAEAIVIGGSCATYFDIFGPTMNETLEGWGFMPKPAIFPSVLGDFAGAMGAAALAKESIA